MVNINMTPKMQKTIKLQSSNGRIKIRSMGIMLHLLS